MAEINSKEYWNERFMNESWEAGHGEEQSEFFASILFDALPSQVKQDLINNAWDIYDYGCAEGAGTEFLSKRFLNCRVCGIDFSEKAISTARDVHPQCSFEVGDITQDTYEADVIISSNTLEHIAQPITVLVKLAQRIKRYLIILVPFEDDSGEKEHINIFDSNSIPELLANTRLVYFKIIDCRLLTDSLWQGKQLMLVYAPEQPNCNYAITAKEAIDNDINPAIDERYRLEIQLSHLDAQLKAMDQEISRLSDLDIQNNRKIEEIKKALQSETEQREKQEILLNNKTKQYNLDLKIYDETISSIRDELLRKSCLVEETGKRIGAISTSIPYKIAHATVEFKHMLFGKKDDRINGRKWLADRSYQTKYNYLKELSNYVSEIGNRDRLAKLIGGEESDYRVIDEIVSKYEGDCVYLMPNIIDWNVPLFQRPQQIAMALSDLNRLFIYFTLGNFDDITKPTLVRDNCLLVNMNLFGTVLDIVQHHNKRGVVDIYSTSNLYDLKWLSKYASYDFEILYEYVDEISEAISGQKIPESTYRRHRELLRNENVYVVATARKLYDEVLKIRGNDHHTLWSGNGVDIKHFQTLSDEYILPDKMQEAIERHRPIIGYFGAIAQWFDFEMIINAARERPDYLFVLVGPEYGGHLPHLKKLQEMNNILMTGAINYSELPGIANAFTVATIPFLLNDITESTSPIKLFEYMAMGKPVVTTAMRECLNYPDVMIAHSNKEYVERIDEAINIVRGQDYNSYKNRLLSVAEENSWLQKAREIINLVENA